MKLFKKSIFDKDFKFNNDEVEKDISYRNIGEDGYTVQGMVFAYKYMLITAYKLCEYSRIYFYEKTTGVYLGYVTLDNKSHVGGVAFDKENNLLFVTGSCGKVNCYNFDSVLSVLKGNGSLEKIDSSNIDISLVLDGNVSAATIYYFEESLYACTCSNVGRMVKYKYKVSKNKILVENKIIYNDLVPCIQGMVVFKYKDNIYYLFSQSFSRLKSTIKVVDKSFKLIGQFVLSKKGLEGIDISNNNIYGVFENSITDVVDIPLVKLTHGLSVILENNYINMGKIHQKKLDNRNNIV